MVHCLQTHPSPRSIWFLKFVVAALLFCGCAGSISTVGHDPDKGAARMYPVSAEVADKLVLVAMKSEFPEGPIAKVEAPFKGYQATLRFALDSHTVVAYAIPAKGRSEKGEVIDGFAFQVSHSGTMPISGGGKARSVFKRIMHDAALIASPLPLDPLSQ